MMKKIYTLFMLLALASCASNDVTEDAGGRYRGSESIYLEKGNGHYKVGNSYKIMGKTYYPREDYNYEEVGIASWYGKDFHAKDTANGEEYDMYSMTAGHRTLPLPSIVEVTNLENGRKAIFRVNDRGPFVKDRIIDLSKRGAEVLGYQHQGTAKVKVKILAKESKALKQALTTGENVKITHNDNSNLFYSSSAKYSYLQPISTHKKEKIQTPVKTGNFYVQAGAFNQESGANNVKQQLSQSFDGVNIYPAQIGSGTFYRVRVGPYKTQREADAILTQVKNNGILNAKTVQD